MKSIILVSLMLFGVLNIFAQNKYSASLDLNNIVNDQIKVTVYTPEMQEKELLFVFPMIVPGTYEQSDYGRFISNFKAFNENGKKIKVKKNDVNSYLFKNAEIVSRIEYLVDDSWEGDRKNFIFQPAGTNFSEKEQFILNNFALFGYFQGYNNMPYEVKVTKPANFYGATSLDKVSFTPTQDVFLAENYVELVDQPILYNIPDTTSYYENGAKINIAVYAPNNEISADLIKETIKPITKAVSYVLGNIPTDEYWFLFYYFYFSDDSFKKGEFSYGALEHKKSSIYYLPIIPDKEGIDTASMLETISDFTSHEFLHILAPLNLHSEEIAYFDFYNTKLSEHLWLYEGVTEYLSIKSRLISDLISMEDFMLIMKEKITHAEEHFENISFTEMSKHIVEPDYAKSYPNVYLKGAVIAMMLDVMIAENTQGKKDLIDLVLDLIDEYGMGKPFKDSEIIDVITRKTSPEVGTFFKKYVIGAEPIPCNDILNKCGLEYVLKEGSIYDSIGNTNMEFDEEYEEGGVDSQFTFGNFKMDFDAENGLLLLSPEEDNPILSEQIAIKKLNGEDISFKLVQSLLLNPETDAPLRLEVIENGKSKEMELTPFLGVKKNEFVMRKMDSIETSTALIFQKLFAKGNR